MAPSDEGNLKPGMHIRGPTCHRKDPAYAGVNPAARPDLAADLRFSRGEDCQVKTLQLPEAIFFSN